MAAEANIKIANDISTRISEVNPSFTAELGRIYTEINGKNNSHDVGYAKEAQEILTMMMKWFDISQSLKEFSLSNLMSLL